MVEQKPLTEFTFELPFIFSLRYSDSGDDLIVNAEVRRATRIGEKPLPPREEELIRLPLGAFENSERIEAYKNAVTKMVANSIHLSTEHFLFQEASTAANLALLDAELTWDEKQLKKFVFKNRTRTDAQFLKSRLGMQGRGRRSQWTKAELARVLKAISRELPKDKQKLDDIHARLKFKYPERTPTSPQSLKQLIYRRKLSLKTITKSSSKGTVNNMK